MDRHRPAFVLPLVAFTALCALLAVYLWEIGVDGKVVSDLPSALIGKPAPQFSLPPIAGNGPGLSTANLKGKVSLVNVFASWCIPCRAEQPMLMQLKKRGITLFGIDYKDKPEDATAFLKEHGNPYAAVGADRTGRVSIDWGVYGYPETFVVDATGRIRYRQIGPIMPHDMETKIMPLLRELKG